ncbi:MAG: TRAP transporter permease [Syntrophaceae bacterium]|nr:TRAP transporter permease [Syntrophaceae bacterium]
MISPFRRVASTIAAVCFSLYTLISVSTFLLEPLSQLAIFLSFSLTLSFLLYPITSESHSWWGFGFDLLLASLSAILGIYITVDHWNLIFRVGMPTRGDIWISVIAVLLVLEATRRTVGKPLVIINIIFLLYAFCGQFLPPPLSHGGYDLKRIATTLALTQNGIFGVALSVMFDYIYLFVIFGTVYALSGGTEFILDLARSLFGRLTGGPAKISVLSSSLFGTISGSAVANVTVDGIFTIPMMVRTGFEPHVAGAIEAVTSTGGALMPPVMGAAAFIMAEYLGIPYISICRAAVFPALLYYLALFAIIHFYAKRNGLRGLPREELPSLLSVMKKRGTFFIPLLSIIFLMVKGYTPTKAVLYTIPIILVLSFFSKNTRIGIRKGITVLENSAKSALIICNACASAGIVIGIVLLTGLGSKLASFVLFASGERLYLALPFIMVSSIILGMGLPTVVCYVLLASTVASPLIKMGVLPIAAHLFIFYFGMLCMVTPPVGFAFYASAAIAGSDPMKTGWTAFKFALPGFILPYMFIFYPSLLLIGTFSEIVLATIPALLGILFLSIGMIGYFRKKIGRLERASLIIAAILLIHPGITTDMIGVGLGAIVLIPQLRREGLSKKLSSTCNRSKQN